jgi:hypothetical protein
MLGAMLEDSAGAVWALDAVDELMTHLEPHGVYQNVGDRYRTAGYDIWPDPGLLQNSGN